jgi:hypothetical protein
VLPIAFFAALNPVFNRRGCEILFDIMFNQVVSAKYIIKRD